MKKQLLKWSLLLFAGSALTVSSCNKDNNEENDEEVITTMQLAFVPQGGEQQLIIHSMIPMVREETMLR